MHTHTRTHVGASRLPASRPAVEGVVIIYDYAGYIAREEIAANRTARATRTNDPRTPEEHRAFVRPANDVVLEVDGRRRRVKRSDPLG